MDNDSLLEAWDIAADALELDPMRPIRYGKCFRYLGGVDRNSKILEVGCGEGTGLLTARHLGFTRLVGVEVSRERITRARDKLGNGVCLILYSPNGCLPFKDACFDVVVSAAVIEHTLSPVRFVSEISRVVRAGGYVVISSDCWQWRILQLLGIYRSVQPIDKAIFPSRLFRIFKRSHFQLVHYEGFPLPGQRFRFLRMISSAAPEGELIRRGFHYLKSLAAKSLRLQQTYEWRAERTYPESLQKLVGEVWTPKLGVWAFLKLLFSDENVFFLVKHNERLES